MAEVKKDGQIARAYAELINARMQAQGLTPQPRLRSQQPKLNQAPDPIIATEGFTRADLEQASKPVTKKAS